MNKQKEVLNQLIEIDKLKVVGIHSAQAIQNGILLNHARACYQQADYFQAESFITEILDSLFN